MLISIGSFCLAWEQLVCREGGLEGDRHDTPAASLPPESRSLSRYNRAWPPLPTLFIAPVSPACTTSAHRMPEPTAHGPGSHSLSVEPSAESATPQPTRASATSFISPPARRPSRRFGSLSSLSTCRARNASIFGATPTHSSTCRDPCPSCTAQRCAGKSPGDAARGAFGRFIFALAERCGQHGAKAQAFTCTRKAEVAGESTLWVCGLWKRARGRRRRCLLVGVCGGRRPGVHTARGVQDAMPVSPWPFCEA